MLSYSLKRIGYMLIVTFVVITITFFLIHMIPGDPIQAMVQDLPEETRGVYLKVYGFDQPLYVQYMKYMKQLFVGDLGQSLRYPGRTVSQIITTYAPISAAVGGIALAIGFVVGIILGIIAALKLNRWSDRTIMILALVGTTLPVFVAATLLQYMLTVVWPIFPTTGWGGIEYIVLPVICMCADPVASYARYMRSSVLDVTNQDYILTAQAKGVSDFRIVTHHVLRNSLIPCLTMLGTSVSGIFAGSFIIETIFAIPGLGSYFISAISDRDYSMVLGLNVVFTGIYIITVLLTDIVISIVDPRIRFEKNV